MYGQCKDLSHCGKSIFLEGLIKSNIKWLSDIKYNNYAQSQACFSNWNRELIKRKHIKWYLFILIIYIDHKMYNVNYSLENLRQICTRHEFTKSSKEIHHKKSKTSKIFGVNCGSCGSIKIYILLFIIIILSNTFW
jgi:hypothetical protein